MGIVENTMDTAAKKNSEVISPCPSTPNCVSSIDKDRKHFVEPLHFEGSAKEALLRLLDVLGSLERTHVKTSKANYIHAETVSAIIRFVDDLEFFFDNGKKFIHVKSASRVGYSDLGVNRRRVEKIRKRFNEREKNGYKK